VELVTLPKQKYNRMKITLKTFYGLEDVLAEELVELGYDVKNKLNRAVQVEGTWKDVYFLNLHSRCALSVLVELHSFTIKQENDLYKEAARVNWVDLFDVSKTFAVKGAVNSTLFKHSQFPFLLVKDAIADQFRGQVGKRPDVHVKAPQVVIDLYVRETEAVLSVNTSGMPLFQRGYRQSTGDAPLNEVVAAALIRMSKWDKKSTFVDPFCGSGTLLIEAALYANNIPSSIERTHYAFKNLKTYQSEVWEEMHAEAQKVVKEMPCEIIGGDIDSQMVMKAKRNLRGFSFGRFIQVVNESVDMFPFPEAPATLITNPPYGERLQVDVQELYGNFGSIMKHKLQGYSVHVISSSETGFNSIGLKPSKKYKLFNGDLECSFRSYEIYAGSKKTIEQDQEA
jgi:putative N6-adenine-specific DNA methylase